MANGESLIPSNEYEFFDEENDGLGVNFDLDNEPSLTYAMNLDKMTFVGRVDDVEAIQQAVMKIINTERYEHEIYSWDYGIELADLRGQSMPYVMSEIKQRIIDALTADDRIESVEDFEVTKLDKRTLLVKFKTVTSQGDEFTTESEVEV